MSMQHRAPNARRDRLRGAGGGAHVDAAEVLGVALRLLDRGLVHHHLIAAGPLGARPAALADRHADLIGRRPLLARTFTQHRPSDGRDQRVIVGASAELGRHGLLHLLEERPRGRADLERDPLGRLGGRLIERPRALAVPRDHPLDAAHRLAGGRVDPLRLRLLDGDPRELPRRRPRERPGPQRLGQERQLFERERDPQVLAALAPAEAEEPLHVRLEAGVPERLVDREPMRGGEPAADLVVHLRPRLGEAAEVLMNELGVGEAGEGHVIMLLNSGAMVEHSIVFVCHRPEPRADPRRTRRPRALHLLGGGSVLLPAPALGEAPASPPRRAAAVPARHFPIVRPPLCPFSAALDGTARLSRDHPGPRPPSSSSARELGAERPTPVDHARVPKFRRRRGDPEGRRGVLSPISSPRPPRGPSPPRRDPRGSEPSCTRGNQRPR